MKKLIVILSALLLCGSAFAQEQEQPQTPAFGIKQLGFMSTPKVGGYIIGSYKYSDQEGANGGPGSTVASSVSMWTAASTTISSIGSSSR